jgi:hypothetical protein
MKYEVDAYNDGCYFILPPDSDWMTRFESMEIE